MNENNLSTVDLNLLVTLDALLSEGSVTKAARRLGIGQPAASHALTRLRNTFDDPLFVRSGRQMVPTPRAEALREPVKRLLADARRILRHETTFDPTQTTRSFVMISPDLIAPALVGLLVRMRQEAPLARLEVRARGFNNIEVLERGLADLALGIFPSEVSGLMTRRIGTVNWSVIARKGHPALRKKRTLSVQKWSAYPHAIVRQGHGGKGIVSSALEKEGIERAVGFAAPSFLAAILAVAETDLFFTAPKELVLPLRKRFGLELLDPPIALPSVPIMAFWHERYHADPAHKFFRSLVLSELQQSFQCTDEVSSEM